MVTPYALDHTCFYTLPFELLAALGKLCFIVIVPGTETTGQVAGDWPRGQLVENLPRGQLVGHIWSMRDLRRESKDP